MNVSKTPGLRARSISQVVEGLCIKYEALSSNPNTTTTKKKPLFLIRLLTQFYCFILIMNDYMALQPFTELLSHTMYTE
jgi:hypothetical protein